MHRTSELAIFFSRRAVAPSTECDTLALAPGAFQARGSERIVFQPLDEHFICNRHVPHAVAENILQASVKWTRSSLVSFNQKLVKSWLTHAVVALHPPTPPY